MNKPIGREGVGETASPPLDLPLRLTNNEVSPLSRLGDMPDRRRIYQCQGALVDPVDPNDEKFSLTGLNPRIAVCLLWMFCSGPLWAATLITNAVIVDGSGTPGYHGSVRIEDGRIESVGDITPAEGDTVVNARGQVLAPGFIDTHSHADARILQDRSASTKITQGITTVVVGQDGTSPFPLADFFVALETTPASVNVAAYAGHNTLRNQVMGMDFRRAASPPEMQAMSGLLRQELEAGALGLSTGLEYEPGIYSEGSEVVLLAQQAARRGGRYISHIRSEDRWFEAAVEEIIDIGRITGMPVQISHLKLAMTRLWGTAPDLLARLDEARAEGIAITADVYPYTYWQSHMMVLLPERDPGDLAAIDTVMAELAPPEGILFTDFAPNPALVGRTLQEIADDRGINPSQAFSELAQASLTHQADTGEPGDMIIATSMAEEDVAALLAWPHANICTDGSLKDRHPRGAGSFPRVLGHYAREQRLFPLEVAIQKMTALPAQNMGFSERGRVAPGYVADLVLLEPDTVTDRATTSDPFLTSAGITAVWVNGQPVLEAGLPTGRYPGKVIRRRTTLQGQPAGAPADDP